MQIQDWLGADNKIGIDIWEQKYRYKDETFDDWLERVSNGNKELEQLIIDKKFLFGGRILANRGLQKLGKKVTFSNCYVLSPPQDNIESIFETASKLARTFSYGGGCGISISNLSPRGAKVNNTANETTGAVSFMDLYSNVTGLIGQNGRRGALMIALDCNHPDLEEFIEIKSDLNKVTNANISIKITDEFMKAVETKSEYTLSYTREETMEKITKVVNAYDLFMKFCEMNWDYGEPAMLFWDEIEQHNFLNKFENFKFECTNPCGELPLPSGGSCLLGSINLAEFVRTEYEEPFFDFIDFREAVRVATIALNDVLDEGLPLHPLQEQRDSVRDWRQIGLGIMGLADMLIKMGYKYGDADSLEFCEMISLEMLNETVITSSEIASTNGTFKNYNYESFKKSNMWDMLGERVKDKVKLEGVVNSQFLTIAPTGTLSTMLGISGGIEPIYANSYSRTTKTLFGEDVTYKVYTPIVEQYMKKHGLTDESELPEFFVTAQTLEPLERIMMQSTWQHCIDASISSTVNLPNSATVEDVAKIYTLAWKHKLKGITVFRDGCKRTGILNIEKEEKVAHTGENDLEWGTVLEVNDDVIGKKRKLMTGCGTLHVSAFFDPDGNLVETYLSKGSSGGCNNYMTALSRMVSLSARAGVGIDAILDQLKSSGTCPSYAVRTAVKKDTSQGSCCPMALAFALKEMYLEMQDELGLLETYDEKPYKAINPCPSCGGELKFEGGCNSCPSCGWSKCD